MVDVKGERFEYELDVPTLCPAVNMLIFAPDCRSYS